MPIPVWWWYISYRNTTYGFASCSLNLTTAMNALLTSVACFLEFSLLIVIVAIFTCVWIKWCFVSFAVDLSVGWEGKEAWEMFGVQHGNWSVWGPWTECSAEAWAGVRHRTRTCTDPAPRRGGRPCVGQSVQYEPCSLGLEGEDFLTVRYLSNRPQVPMGYKLINHAGCW